MAVRFVGLVIASIIALGRGDVRAQCVVGSTTIPSIQTTAIPDSAMAGFTPTGVPVIYLNPAALSFASPLFTQWVYWHECGHHVLGHAAAGAFGYRRPYVDEQEADCWAIRHMVDDGLSDSGVTAIQNEAARALGQAGDGTHLPAFARALNLRACLRGGPGRGSGEGTCRPVTTMQPQTRYRTVMRTQFTRCMHPICNPFGCMPLHPGGDLVTVPVQEPYTEIVPVTTSDCSADAPPTRRSSRWWCRYQRIGSDSWRTSIKFSSEEACTRSQTAKDASPDYLTETCEELDD